MITDILESTDAARRSRPRKADSARKIRCLASIRAGLGVREAARKHKVSASTVSYWVNQASA